MSHNLEENNYAEACSSSESTVGENVYSAIARIALTEYDPADYPDLAYELNLMERYKAWVAECDASPDGWVEMPKGVTGFTDSVFFAFACKQMAHEPIESESEPPVVDGDLLE